MKHIWQKIKRWPVLIPIFRILHPHESTCGICGLPWSSCRPSHTIDMVECTDKQVGKGFFPICEHCWQHESLDAILTAVYDLHEFWLNEGCQPYKLEDMIKKTIRDYYDGEEYLIAEAMERYLQKKI